MAALRGAAKLEDDRTMLYWDLILHSLGDATRLALEALMTTGTYEYQSEFARRYIALGKAEGMAEGKAEGMAEGKAEGMAEGKAEGMAGALLHFLRARGIEVSETQRERIAKCTDVARVDRWVERAATILSADELFVD